jgi:hypothetical protein
VYKKGGKLAMFSGSFGAVKLGTMNCPRPRVDCINNFVKLSRCLIEKAGPKDPRLKLLEPLNPLKFGAG